LWITQNKKNQDKKKSPFKRISSFLNQFCKLKKSSRGICWMISKFSLSKIQALIDAKILSRFLNLKKILRIIPVNCPESKARAQRARDEAKEVFR